MENLTVDRTCQLYLSLRIWTYFFRSSLLFRAVLALNYSFQDQKIYYYSLY